jgi:hypothetical protein
MTTREKKSTSKVIDGLEVSAKVNSVVQLDSGRFERLLEGDDYQDSGWDGCDFRYPNPIREWATKHAIACNVHITGRTFQDRMGDGRRWVRVKIEWVGDGEPNTYAGGWLSVGWK